MLKLFFYENIRRIIIIVVLLIIATGTTMLFISKKKTSIINTESIVFENLNVSEEEQGDVNQNSDEYLYVDVKGEVNTPGVYALLKGKRVVDAINSAGGLTEKANTNSLNLSLKLQDEMVIIVYSNEELSHPEEIKKVQETANNLCNNELKNDACINNVPNKTTKQENQEVNNKININNASLDELKSIPKIGDIKANSIIEYRKQNGDFKTIDDIKNVKGIGDSLFNAIKDYITV